MGKKHHKHHKKSFGKKLWHSVSNNHTLRFLADPVKPAEKIVSVAHDDVKGAVSYTGKHVIQDVDNLSNSVANFLPYILGGAAIFYIMNNR